MLRVLDDACVAERALNCVAVALLARVCQAKVQLRVFRFSLVVLRVWVGFFPIDFKDRAENGAHIEGRGFVHLFVKAWVHGAKGRWGEFLAQPPNFHSSCGAATGNKFFSHKIKKLRWKSVGIVR